jgi:hypothetical protein
MGFAAPVIGPAASGRTRWLNPSYELHSKKIELPRRSEITRWANNDRSAVQQYAVYEGPVAMQQAVSPPQAKRKIKLGSS